MMPGLTIYSPEANYSVAFDTIEEAGGLPAAGDLIRICGPGGPETLLGDHIVIGRAMRVMRLYGKPPAAHWTVWVRRAPADPSGGLPEPNTPGAPGGIA